MRAQAQIHSLTRKVMALAARCCYDGSGAARAAVAAAPRENGRTITRRKPCRPPPRDVGSAALAKLPRTLASIGLAALLSIALVPAAALAGAQQAWAEETDASNATTNSVSTLNGTLGALGTALSSENVADAPAQASGENAFRKNASALETITPDTFAAEQLKSKATARSSFPTIQLVDGRSITYNIDRIYDQMINFNFSLSDTSFVEFNLNSFDKGSMYYRVGAFALYDSNENLLDGIYVDHNDTLTAGWILPAGSYNLKYISGDAGYKQTVTVGYNIVESGTSQYQMIPSDSRTFAKAGSIAIGGKTVLGVLFSGVTLANGDYVDGHYYKINVTKKSSLDIVLAGYGTTLLGIHDSNQNLLHVIQTNGTSTDPDSASLRTKVLQPGTYYIGVLCDDSWAFSKPYQFSVKYTPQSIAGASVSVKSKTYNGKTQKASSVTVKVGGQTLKAGRDYTVSCKAGKNVGSYKVTVKGKGSYTGTKTATFKVNPKGASVKKLKKAKRGFTVAWKKPSKAALKQTTGYQVRWSPKKSMKGAKAKTVKATSSAGKKCTLKVSKLKAGKKYYVQVRTYKKAGGKTYHSSWSKAKAVKTKK